ncbi:MAG TPA: DUF4124 domain-containing protein [Roseateles sp.]
MKRVALGLAMGLLSGLAGAQQVWRCEQDGQVVYTDQPCEKLGRPLPARNLKANVADGLATEAARAASAASAPASAASAVAEVAEAPASVQSVPFAAEDAGSAARVEAERPAPVSGRRVRHAARTARFAMQGLMDTDFVQRGYVPRRQNPAFTPNP